MSSSEYGGGLIGTERERLSRAESLAKISSKNESISIVVAKQTGKIRLEKSLFHLKTAKI